MYIIIQQIVNLMQLIWIKWNTNSYIISQQTDQETDQQTQMKINVGCDQTVYITEY